MEYLRTGLKTVKLGILHTLLNIERRKNMPTKRVMEGKAMTSPMTIRLWLILRGISKPKTKSMSKWNNHPFKSLRFI